MIIMHVSWDGGRAPAPRFAVLAISDSNRSASASSIYSEVEVIVFAVEPFSLALSREYGFAGLAEVREILDWGIVPAEVCKPHWDGILGATWP